MSLVIKRIIDVFLSFIGIVILFPLWLIVSILIKLESNGSVLYKHVRLGKDGNKFTCFKFRSMYVGSDENTLVSNPQDQRVTKIGKFLRKTSFDETPQLINVLFGDMSIVGPRPALPSQAEEFKKNDFDKLLVKPGLTGLTQVSGRNAIPYEKRMELDAWYAKNWSLFLDFKILFKTLFVLFKQEGIYDVK